jgi:hypothetical protein
MDKRRGALAPDQIALLILAIAGFALVALFLFGVFDNEDLSERELCKLSVLSRATVPGVVEDAVPLNCYTEKICITAKKGFFKKTGEFFSRPQAATGISEKSACKQFAGEENIRDIEVVVDNNPINQKKSAKIIQGEVANAMYDCWTMTGQGKLDIWTTSEGKDFGEKIVETGLEGLNLIETTVEPRCIVCSRVAFSDYFYQEDKKVQGAILKQVDYNLYLSREKVPGSSLTYIQTFTDESVGSGYGAINLQETLIPYIGRNDLTAEEFSRVKEILTQVKDSIAGADDRKPLEELLKSDENIKKFLQGFDKQSSAPSSQIAIVFTQIKVPNIKPNDAYWNAFGSGAVVGVLGAISGPGKIASLLIPGPGWVKALFKIGSIGAISLNLAINAEETTIKNQALSAATCGSFESKLAGDQKGCSLVKLMDWSVEGINNLCQGGIEGNL